MLRRRAEKVRNERKPATDLERRLEHMVHPLGTVTLVEARTVARARPSQDGSSFFRWLWPLGNRNRGQGAAQAQASEQIKGDQGLPRQLIAALSTTSAVVAAPREIRTYPNAGRALQGKGKRTHGCGESATPA